MQTSAREFTLPKLAKAFNNGVTATALADIDSDGRLDIGTGVFNDDVFIWLKNDSPESCLVTKLTNKTVTAVFKSTEQVSADKEYAQKLLQQQIKTVALAKFEQLKKTLVINELDGAKQWFTFVYAGDYKKSCQISGSDPDKSRENLLKCQKRIAGFVEYLGKKVSHKYIGSEPASKLINQQDELSTAYYLSEFEHGVGTVVLAVSLKNMQATWRVVKIQFALKLDS